MSEHILSDRTVAQIIASLQYDRDRLIEAGYTGNDCQAALDSLYALNYGPNAVGLAVRVVTVRFEDDLPEGEVPPRPQDWESDDGTDALRLPPRQERVRETFDRARKDAS